MVVADRVVAVVGLAQVRQVVLVVVPAGRLRVRVTQTEAPLKVKAGLEEAALVHLENHLVAMAMDRRTMIGSTTMIWSTTTFMEESTVMTTTPAPALSSTST